MNTSMKEKLKENILYWICEHWRISSGEAKGDVYSFKLLPFLQSYLEDRFPHKVFMKSSQTGVSEISVAEMFGLADLHNGNHLYVFPATKQLNTFVKARILDAIDVNPYLTDACDRQRSMQLIKMRNNFLYFRGSTSPKDVETVDASYLWLDERDFMNQAVVESLYRRTEGQSEAVIREFSKPTYPGFGIDEAYHGSETWDGSDQRKYHIKCESCGHRQWLEWEDDRGNLINFVNKGNDSAPDVICICSKCKKNLNRLQVGEWVAAVPDMSHEVHGYQISKFYHPYSNLNRFYKRWMSPRKKQHFYNHDAGIAYAPPGSKLLEEQILSARGEHRFISGIRHGRCFMGCDVGIPHYWWISQRINEVTKVLAFGTAEDFNEIGRIIERYNVSCCVIDQYPEVEEVIRLKKHFKGRVWSCEFPHNKFEKDPEVLYLDDRSHRKIDVNRTLAMSYLQEEVSSGMISFPIDMMEHDKDNTFIKHMCANARVRQEDEDGEVRYVFPKTGKPDHFFFAGLYNMIACEIAPRGEVVIGEGGWSGSGNSNGKLQQFGRFINA